MLGEHFMLKHHCWEADELLGAQGILENVKISDIKNTLRSLINQEIKFEKAGKLVKTRTK